MTEWKLINPRISSLIERFVGWKEGLDLIKSDIRETFPEFPVEKVDSLPIERGYQEFSAWLTQLIKKNPLPQEIEALNFGLFESSAGIQLYISGSNDWDRNDPEWAVTNDYFPEDRYADLAIFREISRIKSVDSRGILYLALSITVVYLISYTQSNFRKLLDHLTLLGNKKRPYLHIATAFEDGDLFNVCKVTPEGAARIE